jgi:hypothetical protein
MFGFLRRRLVREQIVLIHQNLAACEGRRRVKADDLSELLALEPFDKATTPLMGWDWVVNRTLERD